MNSNKLKTYNNPAPGRILISEPALKDFYFSRSVVLLAEHSSEEGAQGLIINKPLNLKLNEIVKDFPKTDFPVFLGGPVHPDRLFYLHTLGERIPGSELIFDNLYWGGDIQKLIDLIELKLVTTEQVRFFIGYSGWSPNQLENELTQKSWIISNTQKKCIMESEPEKLWSNMIRLLGNDYAIWANYPSDPILN